MAGDLLLGLFGAKDTPENRAGAILLGEFVITVLAALQKKK